LATKIKKIIEGATEINKTDAVIYFKANRGLTTEEHAALSEKLRFEEKSTGLKIVLVPFLLNVVDGEVIE